MPGKYKLNKKNRFLFPFFKQILGNEYRTKFNLFPSASQLI